VDITARAFQAAGADTEMGLKLYSTFLAAGLPAPSLHHETSVGGGPDCLLYFVLAELVRSLLPSIERLGLATAEDIEIDTLEERLREEVVANKGSIMLPPLTAAWSTRD
jgi:hypothetical protein